MQNKARFFSKTALILLLGGAFGGIAVLPYINSIMPIEDAAEKAGLTVPTVILISIVQTTLFLGIMTFTGLWAARKSGMGAPWLDA